MSTTPTNDGGFFARILAPHTVRDIAKERANEDVIEAWSEQIQMVNEWLERSHPELVDESGRTCWGVLVDQLYAQKEALAARNQTTK